MKAWEAAIRVMDAGNHPFICARDSGLLHQIADMANLKCKRRGPLTEIGVANALSKTPGKLIIEYVAGNKNRRMRVFVHPDHPWPKRQQ
jgi:hypothetical protein